MNDAVIFCGINQREALLKKSTGWDNGLSQDYNGKLGTWFADRLGAKQQLRNDMETKNEALELANAMDTAAYFPAYPANPYKQVADMLRSQAAEIKRMEEDIVNYQAYAKHESSLGAEPFAIECTNLQQKIEQYKEDITELESDYTDQVLRAIDAETERDQLKAKNQKLVEASEIALGELDWYIENYAGRSTIKAANTLRDAIK